LVIDGKPRTVRRATPMTRAL